MYNSEFLVVYIKKRYTCEWLRNKNLIFFVLI